MAWGFWSGLGRRLCEGLLQKTHGLVLAFVKLVVAHHAGCCLLAARLDRRAAAARVSKGNTEAPTCHPPAPGLGSQAGATSLGSQRNLERWHPQLVLTRRQESAEKRTELKVVMMF